MLPAWCPYVQGVLKGVDEAAVDLPQPGHKTGVERLKKAAVP